MSEVPYEKERRKPRRHHAYISWGTVLGLLSVLGAGFKFMDSVRVTVHQELRVIAEQIGYLQNNVSELRARVGEFEKYRLDHADITGKRIGQLDSHEKRIDHLEERMERMRR